MKRVVSRLAWVIATWFGCGFAPGMPGTVGTLGAVPLYLLVARGGRTAVVLAAVGVTSIGVWAASVVARELQRKDPQVVVVDEVAGLLVTLAPVAHPSWRAVVVGVLVFRALDTWKPWPVRRFESLPSGWGIVLDDVAAGALGAILLSALQAGGLLS